jgi:hypothetical protein
MAGDGAAGDGVAGGSVATHTGGATGSGNGTAGTHPAGGTRTGGGTFPDGTGGTNAGGAEGALLGSGGGTTSGLGWVETFDADVTQALVDYDPRWTTLLGSLTVGSTPGEAVPDPGNRGADDDYAFRASDAPTGSVQITLDYYWDGRGAVGALGAVRATYPHLFYEATVWNNELEILYIYGPNGGDWRSIVSSGVKPRLTGGSYRTVFTMDLEGGAWVMNAQVQDPTNNYEVVAQVSVTDDRLGPGTQGAGIFSIYPSSSYISEIRVEPR